MRKKYVFAFLILILSAPVFANEWSEDWTQRHYEKAELKANEYTRNPVKKVWRKIVLWDAKNAINTQVAVNGAVQKYEESRPSTPQGYYDSLLMQNAINNATYNMRDAFRPMPVIHNYGPHYGTIQGPHVGETYSFTLY